MYKLEQLELLHSEDTLRRLMTTHTIESYLIPSKKKTTKFKLQIQRIWQNFKCMNFEQTLHATHFLKLFDTMCKYEIDPMSIVEDTERTRFCPQTDRLTDGLTRRNQYTPLSTSLKRGYNDAEGNIIDSFCGSGVWVTKAPIVNFEKKAKFSIT